MQVRIETNDVLMRVVDVQPPHGIWMKSDRIDYELSVKFDESQVGFEVITDRLTEYFQIIEIELNVNPGVSLARLEVGDLDGQRSLGNGKALYYREGDSIKRRVEMPQDLPLTVHNLAISHLDGWSLSRPQEVMLERFPMSLYLRDSAQSLGYISAYDFDPSRAQLAVPPTGSRELDANAENLSVVLREILRHPKSKKRLINLVSVLLPFVRDLDVDKFGFGQLITMLTERFSDKEHRLPAAFASDGTVACLALVVALYFQENTVAVFEEPDRHIHPHLASQVMQMMNEVTGNTQIIVTTHNAELLRHANLEDILLVSRDPDGHSQITRPADSEVVSHFLQNELGVEDLFVQNLLTL